MPELQCKSRMSGENQPLTMAYRRTATAHDFAARQLCCYGILGAVLALASCRMPVSAEQPGEAPEGFTPLFNGKDLDGWWGWGTKNYKDYLDLDPAELAKLQEGSRGDIRKHWRVEDGILVNDGQGLYLTTNQFYRDFELLIDYKTVPRADSGIYLRGCPQVQIWDSTEEGKFGIGADKGSGGLWNNAAGSPGKDPLQLADRPFGQWNQFRIKMIGAYVNVWLNDLHIVRDAVMHNYFDRQAPMPVRGPIQLQTHGGEIRWRNVLLREIPDAEANAYLAGLAGDDFEPIFNGRDFTGWSGPVDKNRVADGSLLSSHGTIFTEDVYDDFIVQFQFQLPEAGNNGLAIRYPGQGDTAYAGMCELQVLDNTAPGYAQLKPQQYHGSIYGMVPARRGYLRPVGQWNFQKVTVQGHHITVELNGFVITDADISKVDPKSFMYDAAKFQGRLRTEGHFGVAGHGKPVAYRDIQIRRLE